MIATLLLAATVAASPQVTTYPVPDKQIPTEIVRHGNEMWFVSWKDWPKTIHANLGRVDGRGKFSMKDVPDAYMPGLIARAPDGTLYLSDGQQPVFWKVAKDGTVEQIKSPRATQGIAFGSDGNLWCTHQKSKMIGKYATDGTEQALYDVKAQPLWIVAGRDGALWFSAPGERSIGRINVKGESKLFPLPPTFGAPGHIVAGDNAVWFAMGGDVLGRATVSGEISTVKIGIKANWLAADSKGRIWYTDGASAGMLAKDGTVREFPVKDAKNIRALAEGPDGAMWFVDQGAMTVGKIELAR